MSVKALDKVVSDGFIIEQGPNIFCTYHSKPTDVGSNVLRRPLSDVCQGSQGLLLSCYRSKLLQEGRLQLAPSLEAPDCIGSVPSISALHQSIGEPDQVILWPSNKIRN
jgi:hypothetical protein